MEALLYIMLPKNYFVTKIVPQFYFTVCKIHNIMQQSAVIMVDENNNNGDRVLSKPAGHYNQLYDLIFTCLLSCNYPSLMDKVFAFQYSYLFKSIVKVSNKQNYYLLIVIIISRSRDL